MDHRNKELHMLKPTSLTTRFDIRIGLKEFFFSTLNVGSTQNDKDQCNQDKIDNFDFIRKITGY